MDQDKEYDTMMFYVLEDTYTESQDHVANGKCLYIHELSIIRYELDHQETNLGTFITGLYLRRAIARCKEDDSIITEEDDHFELMIKSLKKTEVKPVLKAP